MHEIKKIYKPGGFPNSRHIWHSRISNYLWYKALELCFFETNNNTIIPPDPMQVNTMSSILDIVYHLLVVCLQDIVNRISESVCLVPGPRSYQYDLFIPHRKRNWRRKLMIWMKNWIKFLTLWLKGNLLLVCDVM